MISIISLDNVSLYKGNVKILDNLSLDIEKGSFVSVIGGNGSGKTSFLKLFTGLEEYSGYININGDNLNYHSSSISNNVSMVFNDIDSVILADSVYDNLIMELVHLGKDMNYIKKRLNKICDLFKIKDILYKSMVMINNSDKQKVMIASSVMCDPDILLLDDCMNQLSLKDKELVLSVLKKFNKSDGMTIIMTSHNMEDVLVSDRVLVLDKGKVLLDGTFGKVFKKREVLSKCGVDLPFIIDLSLRLIDRKVVKYVYLDKRKLVDNIWK